MLLGTHKEIYWTIYEETEIKKRNEIILIVIYPEKLEVKFTLSDKNYFIAYFHVRSLIMK